MANKKINQSREETDNRAKSAIERARQKVAVKSDDDLSLKTLEWFRERWHDKAVRRKFIETFIKVRDALNENELVDFKFNDIQADLWDKLTGRDVVLKMKRGGLSTLFQAICLANTIVKRGLKARSVPHDPDTETEFRETVKTMFEALPADKRPPTKYYNERRILFTHKSEYRTQSVQPKREGKGRGLAIQILHLTEVAFWIGNQHKALIALLSAAEGGEVYVESTANGLEKFHGLYTNGKKGKGGWRSHFYQWWWRRNCRIENARIVKWNGAYLLLSPTDSETDFLKWTNARSTDEHRFADTPENAERLESVSRFSGAMLSKREKAVALRVYRHLKRLGYIQPEKSWREDWYRPEVAEYLLWRREKIDDIGERDFLIEYPETDSECFAHTGRPVIAPQFLKVTCRASDPVEGHEYMLGVDTSGGAERGNPAAIQVLDVCCGRQVFEEKLKMPPDLLAYRVAEISDRYFRAKIVVERNNTGLATVIKLRELGYEDVLYKHLDARLRRAIDDGTLTVEDALEQAQYGFPTDSVNKPLAGMALDAGVRNGALGLSSQEFCDQALKVVWKDSGSFSGQSATDEDDLFMALAIVWFVSVTMYGMFSGFIDVMPVTGDAR